MDTTKQAILENLDPTTLAEAACILNQLGLPIEVALNMFLKQVILYRGLPFDVILPTQDDVKGESPSTDEDMYNGFSGASLFDKEAFQRDVSTTLEELKKSMKLPFGKLDTPDDR